MRSVLKVLTPADDLSLLTAAERRECAGLATGDTSQDVALAAMDVRVAAAICAECNIAVGSGGEPTLKQETLEETFRGGVSDEVILARRHDVVMVSVTGDGSLFDDTAYFVDPEAGILRRLDDDDVTCWGLSRLTVVYLAGFESIPGDLKMAAMDFFRVAWRERTRDPMVKSEEVEVAGIDRVKRDFWVGSVPGQEIEGAVPAIVSGQLKRFRNFLV